MVEDLKMKELIEAQNSFRARLAEERPVLGEIYQLRKRLKGFYEGYPGKLGPLAVAYAQESDSITFAGEEFGFNQVYSREMIIDEFAKELAKELENQPQESRGRWLSTFLTRVDGQTQLEKQSRDLENRVFGPGPGYA